MQADENKAIFPLDILFNSEQQCTAMAKKKIPTSVALRPNQSDYSLITRLRDKLGVDNSQIIRIALRKLAEAEGLKAS